LPPSKGELQGVDLAIVLVLFKVSSPLPPSKGELQGVDLAIVLVLFKVSSPLAPFKGGMRAWNFCMKSEVII